MNDILESRIRKYPPRTQEECVALAVRQSIAALGPAPSSLITIAARGIAEGLFGQAFDDADCDQRAAWVEMCEREYRRALAHQEGRLNNEK